MQRQSSRISSRRYPSISVSSIPRSISDSSLLQSRSTGGKTTRNAFSTQHLYPFSSKCVRKSRSVPELPTPSPQLPDELILAIFAYFHDVQDLLPLRLLNKRYRSLAHIVLAKRLSSQCSFLETQSNATLESLRVTEIAKQPTLTQNLRFLQDIPTSKIVELSSLKNPVTELVQVAECLIRLRNIVVNGSGKKPESAQLRNAIAQFPLGQTPWSVIRAYLAKYDFRQWLVNLKFTASVVPYDNVMEARKILEDMDITYERMKEVSTAGYQMLIIVAATIQYVENFHAIRLLRYEARLVDAKLQRYNKLLKVVRE